MSSIVDLLQIPEQEMVKLQMNKLWNFALETRSQIRIIYGSILNRKTSYKTS